ncbi:hypothetical protein C4Z38_015070, partial [Klebsiella pneumoniae subsp. pneumoniae]|uniref:hypothetical protein n=1 Tax=Klebsiella pneumoniae TaxID=573 RepID=UPI000CEBB730
WLMMSLWDALRMNMMISYQELVRTFPNNPCLRNGRQGIICSDLYLSISIHVQTATDMALRVHYTSY